MVSRPVISESVLLKGKGRGLTKDMPALDEVVIVKEVTATRNCTWFLGVQCSLEDHKRTTINAQRFKKFKTNGHKLFNEILDQGYEGSGKKYKVYTNSGSRAKEFVIKDVSNVKKGEKNAVTSSCG